MSILDRMAGKSQPDIHAVAPSPNGCAKRQTDRRGPQLLITADLVRGRQMACWPEVREELEKAGGIFVDEALVEDSQFITGRMPGSLRRHLYGVLQYLQGKQHMQPRDQRRATAA